MRLLARLGAPLAAVALVLAALLRFYDLEHNPPGLWQDEASTGVDAYLLWHTGADRAGERFPLISRSFGDYPFALYRYLDAPIVGLLGPSAAKERVVAATASLALVVMLVVILRRRFGPASALGGALSAAICPTWIHLARYGSEQILLPVTLTLGLALFELGKDATRRRWLWIGAFVLGLAAYSYHAAKVLLPLWMLGFVVYHWPTIKSLWPSEKRHVIGPALLFTAMVVPSVMIATTPEGSARARDAAAFYRLDGLELVRHTLGMYGHYWRPSLLFFTGADAKVLSPPGLGLWTWVDLPLILLGLGALAFSLRAHPGRRLAFFFLFWFLIGPIPAALGYEPSSITRLIGWLPAPQALAGMGFGWLAAAPKMARKRQAVVVALVILWATGAGLVIDRLILRYPKIAQREWQYEISSAIRCARSHAESMEPRPEVVVSPAFTYADTFAQFWLATLPPRAESRRAYSVGSRKRVGPGELYAAPAGERVDGTEVCAIRLHGATDPASRVWGPPASAD